VVCHSLLQWTTFCQTSPPWPARLGWPHRAWLSFIELDKAVVRVIRLTSFLWLWFQCVCPLMPSHNNYRLTWISLTLDEGYLLTATPPDLERGVAPLGPPAPIQPLLLGRVFPSVQFSSVAQLCPTLCDPMNSMKRQNDRILKKELPRSVGAQYATGDQRRNNSRRMKGWSQRKTNTQLWMWLVIEARADAIKSNIA